MPDYSRRLSVWKKIFFLKFHIDPCGHLVFIRLMKDKHWFNSSQSHSSVIIFTSDMDTSLPSFRLIFIICLVMRSSFVNFQNDKWVFLKNEKCLHECWQNDHCFFHSCQEPGIVLGTWHILLHFMDVLWGIRDLWRLNILFRVTQLVKSGTWSQTKFWLNKARPLRTLPCDYSQVSFSEHLPCTRHCIY